MARKALRKPERSWRVWAAMTAAVGVGGGMCFEAERMGAWHVRLLDEEDKEDKEERHATERH